MAMVRSKLNDPRPMPHKKSAKRWHASPRMLSLAAASVATARVMLVATRGHDTSHGDTMNVNVNRHCDVELVLFVVCW